jgi:uncharacterized membrane protein YgdD (TMEM256/DUF423 family)
MDALTTGAIVAGLGVALGAFGAHALRRRLGERADVYRTGVHYQMIHGLALVGLGVWQRAGGAPPAAATAGWLWLAGVVLFSGSLYVLSLRRVAWLGPVTPIGGLVLLAGWAACVRAALG